MDRTLLRWALGTLLATLAALVLVAAAPPAAGKPVLRPQACPCGGQKVCTGPRGGRYCVAPGGGKMYVR